MAKAPPKFFEHTAWECSRDDTLKYMFIEHGDIRFNSERKVHDALLPARLSKMLTSHSFEAKNVLGQTLCVDALDSTTIGVTFFVGQSHFYETYKQGPPLAKA